jgi:hypothetical protein
LQAHETGDAALAAEYLEDRWQDQCAYFERKAAQNQKNYLRTRLVTLFSSWATPVAVFGLFVIRALELPETWQISWDFFLLILSTTAIGSYQWEELHNYGAQWAKFRLVAERLKGHRQLYLQRSGIYRNLDDREAAKRFVEYCEGLIEGNDINYFILMVDPLRQKTFDT